MATSIGVKLKMDGESEFRKGLQNIVSETKSLDKQLGALESSFDDNKKSLEENAKQTELLEKKKEALQKQIEETSKALEYAKQNYKEGSKEIFSWEGALADAEKALNETNSRLQENADYEVEATSALGQLTAEIASQTSELESLRDAYIDAVLQYGEGSDQANELAGKMATLNGELQNNKSRLEEASASADNLSGSLSNATGEAEELGNGSVEMSDIFGGSIGQMASVMETHDLAGLIGMVVEVLEECGSTVVQTASDFVESIDDMVVNTGLLGDELDALQDQAKKVFDSVVTDQSLNEISAMMSEFNTRLGMTDDTAKVATEQMAKYSDVLGTNGVASVDSYVDALYQWGLASEDQVTNLGYMSAMMDKVAVAQSLSKATTQELESALSDNAGQYQALGLGITDVLALITAYNQAGGTTSELTSGIGRAVRVLAENTDDVPGAFQAMLDSMSSATSVTEALNTEVGDTGKTIQDILGKSAATAMVNTFMNGKVETDKYRDALSNAAGTVQTFYEETRTAEDYIAKLWDYGNKSTAYDNVIGWIENIGKGLFGLGDDADKTKERTSDAVSAMEQDYRDLANELMNPIDLHVTAPSIGYNQTGSSFVPYDMGRKTYAKAYDQAMILTAPTIFGAMGNNLLVGGDRPGNEIVVGEQHLLDLMSKAVSRSSSLVVNVYGAEGQSEEALADAVIDKLQREILGSEAVYA